MQGNSSSASRVPSLIMDSSSSSFSSFSSSSSSSDLEIGRSPSFPLSHPTMGPAYGLVRSRTPLRALFFADASACDSPRHFLDSCFLCRKPLPRDRDIFMYRGDLPFCSEECRHQQIVIDQGDEKHRNLSLDVSSWMDSNKAQAGTVAEPHEIQIRRTDAVAATI